MYSINISTDRRATGLRHLKNISVVSIVIFVTMMLRVNKFSIYFLVTMSTLTNEFTNVSMVNFIPCMSRSPKLIAYSNYVNFSEVFRS